MGSISRVMRVPRGSSSVGSRTSAVKKFRYYPSWLIGSQDVPPSKWQSKSSNFDCPAACQAAIRVVIRYDACHTPEVKAGMWYLGTPVPPMKMVHRLVSFDMIFYDSLQSQIEQNASILWGKMSWKMCCKVIENSFKRCNRINKR